MTRETADIWHDDYQDRAEGRGIYRNYIEPEYDPDAEPNYGRMNAAMAKLVLTLDELNHQEELKKQRMEQLEKAMQHLKYLTRGNKQW